MASSLHLLRLPSIHPSHPHTFRKPYSLDSPPTLHLPASTSHFNLRSSSSKTILRASLGYPITYNSKTLKKHNFFPSLSFSSTVKSLEPFGTSTHINNPLLHQVTDETRPKWKTICKSSSSYKNNQTIPAIERLISAMVYCLPFLNGLNYGVFLFSKYPILELAFDPIVPVLSFYRSIPGASFLAFFTLYIGLVRDRNFSRYVRFNSLQAMMLDVLLVLPSLSHVLLDASSQEGLKFQLLELSYGGTFIGIVFCFLYALCSSVLGRIPHFPFVTDAVDWQIFAVDRQL